MAAETIILPVPSFDQETILGAKKALSAVLQGINVFTTSTNDAIVKQLFESCVELKYTDKTIPGIITADYIWGCIVKRVDLKDESCFIDTFRQTSDKSWIALMYALLVGGLYKHINKPFNITCPLGLCDFSNINGDTLLISTTNKSRNTPTIWTRMLLELPAEYLVNVNVTTTAYASDDFVDKKQFPRGRVPYSTTVLLSILERDSLCISVDRNLFSAVEYLLQHCSPETLNMLSFRKGGYKTVGIHNIHIGIKLYNSKPTFRRVLILLYKN
jgi:hypothetical protein